MEICIQDKCYRVELAYLKLRAIGLSPLITNNSSIYGRTENIKRYNNLSHEQRQYEESRYKIDEKTDGIPAWLFKEAMISVAHTIVGNVSKTLVKNSVWIKPDYEGWLNKIEDCIFPPAIHITRELLPSFTKNGLKRSRQIRCRARYDQWSIPLTVEYITKYFSPDSIINLLNIAGMCAGFGQSSPDRGGDNGRFKVIREIQ